MADKVVSGIGRELRYLEYKFRKKQQKKKKDKNGYPTQDLAWSDSAQPDDSTYGDEVHKPVSGNRGDEDIQIQVALAVSREEEKERAKQLEGDKIRLEMAIKESMKAAESVKTQPTSQPNLLDVSLTTSRADASSASDLFGSSTLDDPWGASAPPTTTSFDPFAPQQNPVPTQGGVASISAQRAVASNSFSAPTNAWTPIPQSSASTQVLPHDPWGVSTSQSFAPQTSQLNAFSALPASNPWDTPAPVVSSQNVFPPAQNGPWGTLSAPVPNHTASFPAPNDPWGNLAVAAPNHTASTPIQNNAWGNPTAPIPNPTASLASQSISLGNPVNFAAPQPVNLDPFSGMSSTPAAQPQGTSLGLVTPSVPAVQNGANNPFGMGDSTTFTAPPFDPLQDFDSLHIGSMHNSSELEPVVLQADFESGQSVAKGLFPLTNVMEPTPVITATANVSLSPTPAPTNSFLGENSSLVNLDSGWKAYQVPFCAKPLGTATHNPFQQTGPSKTLNEMKSLGNQPGF